MDEKIRNQRLVKTYGITSVQYDAMLEEQAGGCKICGRPPVTRALHVDHDHKIPNSKIVLRRHGTQWMAISQPKTRCFTAICDKQAEARRKVKRQLLAASVRGLICHRHNRGLQCFYDSPEHLETAAAYLRRYYERL